MSQNKVVNQSIKRMEMAGSQELAQSAQQTISQGKTLSQETRKIVPEEQQLELATSLHTHMHTHVCVHTCMCTCTCTQLLLLLLGMMDTAFCDRAVTETC